MSKKTQSPQSPIVVEDFEDDATLTRAFVAICHNVGLDAVF